MKIKNVFLIIITSLFIFGSCDNAQEYVPTVNIVTAVKFASIDPANVPKGIKNYVASNYPSSIITNAYRESFSDKRHNYEVKLDNDTELYFDDEDRFLGHNNNSNHISLPDLPVSITSYIKSRYPGTSTVKAEIKYNDGDMIYEIRLSNGIEVYFNDQGSFIEQENDNLYIPASDLPKTITDYISTNYPDLLVINTEMDYDNGEYIYKVKLDNHLKLHFDRDGDLLKEDKDHLDISKLPKKIIDYVTINYPEEQITKAEKEFEDGSLVYKVELSDETKLIFNNDGSFNRVDG